MNVQSFCCICVDCTTSD